MQNNRINSFELLGLQVKAQVKAQIINFPIHKQEQIEANKESPYCQGNHKQSVPFR